MFAGLLLAGGSLGDRFGRKGALQLGLALFAVTSVLATLAGSPGQLIAARAAMGIGGALIFPATLAILTNVFHDAAGRAKAIGILGRRLRPGRRAGPVAGGWLLGALLVGLDLPGEGPDRHRRPGRRANPASRLTRPARRTLRPARPRPVGGDLDHAGLHGHRGPAPRADLADDPRRASRWPRSCWAFSSPGNGTASTRCWTCGSSATPGSAPPPRRSPSRSSRCSGSSPDHPVLPVRPRLLHAQRRPAHAAVRRGRRGGRGPVPVAGTAPRLDPGRRRRPGVHGGRLRRRRDTERFQRLLGAGHRVHGRLTAGSLIAATAAALGAVAVLEFLPARDAQPAQPPTGDEPPDNQPAPRHLPSP
ncbi:MFS transporter [Actinomadura sp. KC216]|nr:MFS transporter [Actinomadura sp. KC216]